MEWNTKYFFLKVFSSLNIQHAVCFMNANLLWFNWISQPSLQKQGDTRCRSKGQGVFHRFCWSSCAFLMHVRWWCRQTLASERPRPPGSHPHRPETPALCSLLLWPNLERVAKLNRPVTSAEVVHFNNTIIFCIWNCCTITEPNTILL